MKVSLRHDDCISIWGLCAFMFPEKKDKEYEFTAPGLLFFSGGEGGVGGG